MGLHRLWMDGVSGGELAVFKNADLSGLNLYNLDMRGAVLVGADLSRVNVAAADFSLCNMSAANLTGATLAGAKMVDTILIRAQMVGANLTGADLAGAKMIDADLERVNLRNVRLHGANLTRADLNRADIGGANFKGATMDRVVMSGGVRWERYVREVVPALCTAGGRSLEEVAAAWDCHSWLNCPMSVAFGVTHLNDVPLLYQQAAAYFIDWFDAGALPRPI